MAKLEESDYLCDPMVDPHESQVFMHSPKMIPQACENYIMQSTGIVSFVKEVKKRDLIFYSGTAMQISFFMESLIASPPRTLFSSISSSISLIDFSATPFSPF